MKGGRHNPLWPLPCNDRGADEHTEYDLAVRQLSAAELTVWVRRYYKVRYVPEAVLAELGLSLD